MKAAKNVSAHALQRFKEIHKSKGTKHQMISYCNNGIEIDPQMAATLSGAEVGSKRAMSNDIFSLKKDHSGIFVVDRDSGTIITFLRFGNIQKDICSKLYGESQPSCCPPMKERMAKIVKDFIMHKVNIPADSIKLDNSISNRGLKRLSRIVQTSPLHEFCCEGDKRWIWEGAFKVDFVDSQAIVSKV